ncbi:hypothetical protein CPC16_010909 [Podila verticillata]|nr:hypothetical protein BGZ59_008584 [Podila verticillata]KAF9379149.1 hypothetical protein CPC16_010909 [Podila verticillata]KFH66574.1 hypothetical protein MVEG_07099 [Podila verticillata NRRL 6337]
MSFADLERGEGGIKRAPGQSPLRGNHGSNYGSNGHNGWNKGHDVFGNVTPADYDRKVKEISDQVFRISSNITSIQRLVGYVGTSKDTEEIRSKLLDVTEQTRVQVKVTSENIKYLTTFEGSGKKLEYQKVSKDFQKVLVEFQKVQRISAEKQREFVHKARLIKNEYPEDEGVDTDDQPLMDDAQRRLQLLVVDNELEYNESMIVQREDEIREIEQGITELNEIFRDLGAMVHEQGSMLDSIEANVASVTMTTHAAAEELVVAAEHQKAAQSKSCYLLMIAAIVTAVILLAIM